jgi:hypothetical protein
MIWLMQDLFATTLDGRNASTSADLERLLGRPTRDLAEMVRKATHTGVWRAAAQATS